jgi:hypothetical protein
MDIAVTQTEVAQCVGKDAMPVRVAIRRAKFMRRNRGCNAVAYKCDYCGKWHIGRSR